MKNLLEETKYILKKYHIVASKSLGQNFLINNNIVEEIVSSANIGKEDLVIEIGPGIGTLTHQLLENAGKVIAIELDDRMIPILEDRFHLYSNFKLLHDDVLKVNLHSVIEENQEDLKSVKIVANLPYYITTPILMKLLEEALPIDSITVMVQKEVAERVVAQPGSRETGAITYSVHYYAEPKDVIFVPKESFLPAPEVNSEVIQLVIRKEPIIRLKDKNLFFTVIKASFAQRRKTLLNGLTNAHLIENKEEGKQLLQHIGLPENIRGENLTLEQFAQISNQLTSRNT